MSCYGHVEIGATQCSRIGAPDRCRTRDFNLHHPHRRSGWVVGCGEAAGVTDGSVAGRVSPDRTTDREVWRQHKRARRPSSWWMSDRQRCGWWARVWSRPARAGSPLGSLTFGAPTFIGPRRRWNDAAGS